MKTIDLVVNDARKFFFHIPRNRLDRRYQLTVIKMWIAAFAGLGIVMIFAVFGNPF